MIRYARLIFRLTYIPIEHQTIKQDFLGWYHEGAQSQRIIEQMHADNSDLISLAINAAKAAEHYDKNSPAVELIDGIDNLINTAETCFWYLVLALSSVGILSLGGSIVTPQDIVSQALIWLGGIFLGTGFITVGVYQITKHQIQSNATLIRLYNERLTERPGDIRKKEQEWSQLAAKYFWNRSLCNPKIHLALLFLSILKIISPTTYGRVSGDLRHSIQDFIGKDAWGILKHQLEQMKTELADEERRV